MAARRLERHPLTPIERGAPVTIHHNGKKVPGYANEPLAVALYAAHQRILSRSMRYHRSRGLFCGTGGCTHCFQRVNGQPNVRTCLQTCQDLDWLEDQNAFPNAEHDVLAAADLAFPNYLDAHTSFIRPRFLRPIYTRVIRDMAGYGKVPASPVAQTFRAERAETDICIVGGGIAGLAAAEAAASTGLHVLLIEREARLGGRLNRLTRPFDATSSEAPKTEGKAWSLLAQTKLQHAGVTIRLNTRLFGIYHGNQLACATPHGLLEISARAIVLAPGGYDAYDPFPGSDRAGVLLAGAALRLLNEYGVTPGDDVAIVGATRQGLMLARDLHACGVHVRGVVDPRPRPGGDTMAADVQALGIPVLWQHRATRVIGRGTPRGLAVDGQSTSRIAAEAVILATGRQPAVELLQQAGCQVRHAPEWGGFVPALDASLQTSLEHVFAAGTAAGVSDEWGSHLSGRLAGLGALHSLSLLAEDKPLEQAQEAWRLHRGRSRPAPRMVAA